jgi:hypothetical protein
LIIQVESKIQNLKSNMRSDSSHPTPNSDLTPIWIPSEEQIQGSYIAALMQELGLDTYPELHRWSVEHWPEYWQRMIQQVGIQFRQLYTDLVDFSQVVTRPQWLINARLNIVDSCFQAPGDAIAIYFANTPQLEGHSSLVSEGQRTEEKRQTAIHNSKFIIHNFPLRRHGDQIERLPNGYYRAHGRVDDTMNLGGIKVSSMDIERVVNQVEGIAEAVAIASTPPTGGPSQLVIYAVVTNSSADTSSADKSTLLKTLQAAIKQQLNPLSAFEVLARAKHLEAQGRSIIHLEVGQPDFPTPANICEAACQAMQDGYTGYGPAAGLLEFRKVIADHVAETRNVAVHPDEMAVTSGTKPIVFFTLLALVNAGDEVIYPDPGFPVYESVINFVGARGIPLRLNGRHGSPARPVGCGHGNGDGVSKAAGSDSGRSECDRGNSLSQTCWSVLCVPWCAKASFIE